MYSTGTPRERAANTSPFKRAMTPRFCTCAASTPPSPRPPILDSWTMSFCIRSRESASRSAPSSSSGMAADSRAPPARRQELSGVRKDRARVDALAVDADLVVQVRAGAVPGAADQADHLALLDVVTGFDVEPR